MTYNVIDIADAILRIAKTSGSDITPIRLNKLAYLSQRRYYNTNGIPLFKETIEAWQYGPVIPALYNVTKQYGRTAIPFEKVADARTALDAETIEFLESIYRDYLNYSDIQLASIASARGSPYQATIAKYGPISPIPLEFLSYPIRAT
mgnify:CR=1 FL=1